MLNSIGTREESLPAIPVDHIVALGTLCSFVWLLLQDRIHPLFVYLMQSYLTF